MLKNLCSVALVIAAPATLLAACNSSSVPTKSPSAPGEPPVSSARAAEPTAAARTRAYEPEVNVDAPAPEGTIGTPHAVVVTAASPTMDWVSLCQAREDTDQDGVVATRLGPHGEWDGDMMVPYFVEGTGTGVPIQAFLGADPSGRFVAFLRDGALLLRDVRERTEVDLSRLGADVRSDLLSHRTHRAVSFDPLGRYLTYMRRQGPRTWVILRELMTGMETPVDPGPGLLWRAEFVPSGEFLRISVVSEDTNGDRRLSWPVPKARDMDGGCSGSVAPFTVTVNPGDDERVQLYHLRSGNLRAVSGLVETVGSNYIIRDETGQLLLQSFESPPIQVSSEDCLGRVYHVDDASGTVLFGCSGTYGGRRFMFTRTSSVRTQLKIDMAPFEADGRLEGTPRLLILNPHKEAYLYDFAERKFLPLTPETKMLATYGATLLAERAGQLYWIDHLGVERAVGLSRPSLSKIITRGRFVALGRLVLDLEARTVTGRLPRNPLALSASGDGLVAATEQALVPVGPLRWREADKNAP